MIDYIRGVLAEVKTDAATLEVNGIGYELALPARSITGLPAVGERLLLYTYLQVLDNEFKLYGFINREEQQLFRTLLGVSGIGARGALNILGSLEPQQFYAAVASQDEKTLTKAPGVGKKMAQRLVFELRDKLPAPSVLTAESPGGSMAEQVLEALEVLGYNRAEVFPVIREIAASGQLGERVEDNIKMVLKHKASQSLR